jgi:hypothetical protein
MHEWTKPRSHTNLPKEMRGSAVMTGSYENSKIMWIKCRE